MFGTDGASLRRVKMSFKDGLLECVKPNTDTAGLALLWPVDGFGMILLPTTCLPERERPYCLNVEIARARLMHTISRREDWCIFDSNQELEEISHQAQDLFVRAVQQIQDPAVASQLADRSLKMAMVFSERLAMLHAETLFKMRRKAKRFGRNALGIQVRPELIDEPGYVDHLAKVAPFAMVPIHWSQVEPEKGRFDFSVIDHCIEALNKKHMIMGAGPLLSFTKESLPPWLMEGRTSFGKVRETAYRYILEVVTRYTRKIHRWFAISGLNASNCMGFSVEQVLEMTRAATTAINAINSRAFKIIEVTHLWGEYYATAPHSISPVAYMDMVMQSGITFDGFSLQMRFGKDQSGMHIRDMMQISSLLEYLSVFGKPLYITGVEIPSHNGEGPYDPRVAGIWHREWEPQRQAAWLEQFTAIGLSKPLVESMIYGNLADHPESVVAHSGLLDSQFEPKDAFRTFTRLRETIYGKRRS